MRKPLLVSFMCAAVLSAAFAGPVDQDRAAKVARNFYYEHYRASKEISFHQIEITRTVTRQEKGECIYYAFSFSPVGFVVVPAEDAVTPVIAFSFESGYDSGNEPVQLTEWMDNVRDQILYHRQSKSQPTGKIVADWQRLSADDPSQLNCLKGSKSIDPLLTSDWDQGSYYNELCPLDADGPSGRVWAGCVATAMAQVMFYYRYPNTGNGTHNYNSPYGPLSANFGNTTYRWDDMTTSVHSSNLAVATLLLHCGIGVNMHYSPSGSGANSDKAAETMINHFRYSSLTRMENKDDYSASDWADLLKAQLDAKKPMYYHGFGSGGHAFNVDGYMDNDYFHFNWGWSGSYNGYYFLDNLNPGGNDFTWGQGAMVDIFPAENYPSYCTGSKTVTGLEGTLDDGSGPMNYQGNSDCYYLLNPQSTPDDSITNITLTFEKFDTETDQDIVTIYDGSSSNDPVLGVFSGSILPSSITSTGNTMLVRFTTNGSNEYGGWLASYKCKLPDYCPNIATFTALSGTLDDGSAGKHYNNKTVCQYLIKPPKAQKITLTFSAFQLESQYDFVEVYEFDTVWATGNLVGHYSGTTLPPNVVSQSGAMFIIFFANGSVNADGWTASYNTQQVGIDETSTVENLLLYPNPARHQLNLELNTSQSEPTQLMILDISGRVMIRQAWGSVQNLSKTLDISTLSAGVYLVRIQRNSGVINRRITVE